MDTPTTAIALRTDLSLAHSMLCDDISEIFEGTSTGPVVALLDEYRVERAKAERIAALLQGPDRSVVRYFVEGSEPSGHVSLDRLFELQPAVAVMNARFWDRCMDATDIGQAMPEERAKKWRENIEKRRTPDFTPEIVLPTLEGLMAQRWRFFAEKVDGAFRGLSGDHVTNSPMGFRKRMIFANAVEYGSWSCGHVHDLRSCIAKLMRRDEPSGKHATRQTLEWAQRHRTGQWLDMDGGSWRVRVYKNGNAHLEVHPELAARLNDVLASIHPNAIPAEHRQRNRKPPKGFNLYGRPLPFVVLDLLSRGSFERYRMDGHCTYAYRGGQMCGEQMPCGRHGVQFSSEPPPPAGTIFSMASFGEDKGVLREAAEVLEALGASRSVQHWVFDYDAREVLQEVIASGVIPDQRAHQFYPTPRTLAERVVALAEIGEGHSVLEPSAGQGGLADLLPPDRTTLVEVAPLFCEVLRAKGFPSVVSADFLRWSPGRRFDRVVMNPPFDRGRWRAHLDHAASLTAARGRIVAVLPAGAPRSELLPGWRCSWSEAIPFPGTSIEVVVLVADRGNG